MYDNEIRMADLLLENKLLRDQVRAFESGEKYVRMKEEFKKVREADARHIHRLERELATARLESKRVRNLWIDLCDELDKKLNKLSKKYDDTNNRLQKKTDKISKLMDELEEEQEKNKALQIRVNKNYKNSSKSSSLSPNHPKIANSRQKTGRSPGGQKGHAHHGRKMHEPTRDGWIDPPKEFLDTSRYTNTGRSLKKQLVKIHVIPEVIEYGTDIFFDKKTGKEVHANFPPEYKDDVNYDGTVKAFAYMVNNSLYTSVSKTKKFIKEISHGTIDISEGFICNLAKEFSRKTAEERDEIFNKLLASPTLHSDFTFGRVNGKMTAVIICASGGVTLYQGREKKGDEGVKGSPLELYEGITITDHEACLIKHGQLHQECMAHVLRYTISGIENEPDKTWHTLLADWIGRAIAYWNNASNGEVPFEKSVSKKYIDELRGILKVAADEYEYDPPSRYFKDAYNLYKRISEDFDDYVLFLRDIRVEPTNSIAEVDARKFKRKAAQVMNFRAQHGVDYFCDGLSVMETIVSGGENLYDGLTERFNRR